MRLEIVGIVKVLVTGGVVTVLGLCPAAPYGLQQLVLHPLGFEALRGIGDRRLLAKQINIRDAALLPTELDRGLHFEHGAAFIGRPIGTPPKLRIEFGADPFPQDTDRHVDAAHIVDRGIDCLLERSLGAVEPVS